MSDFALPSPLGGMPSITAPVVPKLAAGAPQPRLHKAATDFEAIFLRQVLAQARKSGMGDTLFSSDANSTFTQMQDARFADIAAGRDALGLAGLIERQLGARTKPVATDNTAVATTKGGAA